MQTLTRTHQVDILVTEALRAELDTRFVLGPCPPNGSKGLPSPWLPTPCEKGRWPPLRRLSRREIDDWILGIVGLA